MRSFSYKLQMQIFVKTFLTEKTEFIKISFIYDITRLLQTISIIQQILKFSFLKIEKHARSMLIYRWARKQT